MIQKKQRGRIRIKSDIVSRAIHGEEVILDLETGMYFGLNEAGTRIWNWIGSGADSDRIVDNLISEYAIPPARASEDLKSFLGVLTKKGLIYSEA